MASLLAFKILVFRESSVKYYYNSIKFCPMKNPFYKIFINFPKKVILLILRIISNLTLT